MRIETVTAQAFGPLADRTMTFSPGLTVVAGANESAKSSWHAAIRAALCGSPAERYRPWSGTPWRVSATVEMADGRHVELDRALDADDCPDASTWLGLDRTSFAATACVDQAQLLGVLDAADGLQEQLRRAAATAGTDRSATEALARLKDPADALRAARNRLREAETDLAHARRAHAEYLELASRTALAAREAQALAAREARKALEEHTAELMEHASRLARAQELYDRFGDTPPSGLAAQEELARQVNAALAAWRAAPTPRQLTGPGVAEIEAELAALPPDPDGPLEVEDEIRSLATSFEAAVAVLEAHELKQAGVDVTTSVPPAQLRELAGMLDPASGGRLTTATIAVDSARQQQDEAAATAARAQVESDVATARLHELGEPRGAVARPLLLCLGAATAVVGGLLLFVGQGVPGVGVLVAAAFAFLAGMVIRRDIPEHDAAMNYASRALANANEARTALFHADRTLAEAEGQKAVAVEAARVHDETATRCTSLGLPSDPDVLRLLADRSGWEAERSAYVTRVSDCAEAVRSALTARGKTEPSMSVADLLVDYETDCKVRARQATMAAQRPVLTQALADRSAAEAAVVEAAALRKSALSLLRSAVTAISGSASGDPVELLKVIADWQRGWESMLRTAESERNDWAELTMLLSGTTLGALSVRQAGRRERHAVLLAEAIRLGECHAEVDAELAASAPALAAALASCSVPSVPDAEEAVAACASALARLEEHAAIVVLTTSFLSAAAEKVYSDLAPVLEESLRVWLPVVTSGRYVDARVSGSTLDVSVLSAGGSWQPAVSLSLGTAEQVYLLLRFALAQQLTSEACPLLLDDVTVQADDARTLAILDLLLALSEDRQIVLFAQETAVLEWALERLPDSSVHQLEPVTT
ncbi:hypothetical protein Lesp02_46250 [Lentzea sp. NBRC 105346]|uniref:ATP-binding protein n=1 Tax=Lentzea sp. NBRC 105346 TaxID=3032205 RepID=UPI0024A53E15|nr:AAA family ATPase [Lentzea sp. NBRC 105346]GLZ32437.1 hypothetical protein Lesp02_46250 [Lentzea sp. NBRC 105346]